MLCFSFAVWHFVQSAERKLTLSKITLSVFFNANLGLGSRRLINLIS